MTRTSFLYISTFILLFSITISEVASLILGVAIFFVPYGFRSFVIAIIILILAFYIFRLSDKKKEIVSKLRHWFVLWIPLLIYLLIRSEFSSVGLFKFSGFVMKVFFPCMVFGMMYIHNREIFQKYFISTLIVVNLILVAFVPFAPSEEDLYQVSIWLSRGIAISIFFLVIDIQANLKKIFYSIILIIILLCAMIFIGSRGPVLSLLITLSFYFCLKVDKKIIAIPLVIYCIYIFVISVIYIPVLRESAESFMTHGQQNKMQVSEFADNRIKMYKPSLEIIKKNPLIGCGLGNFVLAYFDTFISEKAYTRLDLKSKFTREYYYWPHNILLEILCELGIIGLLLYSILFYPFKYLFDIKNKYNYLVLMGFLFAATSDDITGNSAPLIFSMLSFLSNDHMATQNLYK